MIYESLDNALYEKDEKFKTTRLKNPYHNIERYNLYGFTSRVQRFAVSMGLENEEEDSRIVQWKSMASSRINFAEVYSFFNDESRLGDVLQTLEPNANETSRKYWLTVKDYMPHILNWVHKVDFKETVLGFIDSMSKRLNKDSPTGRSFYGDVSGESVQVFTEAPPGISKFGQAYRPSYVFDNPHMIPLFKRGKNVRRLPPPQIMAHAIDMSTSLDINPLRELEDSSLYAEFDRWFAGDMTVDRRVQHPRSFFKIILGLASMGWLGDEHIHEYFRLISEKQRQYPNALVQRVTHTDTLFWLLIPVNLDGEHWVLARVDFRKNKV
ncbi:hypothetical protein CUMW_198230 [Citrus unshiu]|uniref:Ubiquitin-like protease family profile domain-containing protein n=1 Tax=Citrus unshiu TaxID=55188 RepID=A0A2H5Q5K2_CITUN|nr:hypothetical protein CUMW_198230 [Citrus unshiu]